MTDIDESERPSVQTVCHDFRVREDGILAQQLQEQEFEQHYLKNRSERKTVRGDVRVAKETYLEEVRTAQVVPEDSLTSITEREDWLARDLQAKLQAEEDKHAAQKYEQEDQDGMLAKKLQKREALKLEHARQKRLQRQQREEQMLQEAVTGLQERIHPHATERVNGHLDRGTQPDSMHDRRPYSESVLGAAVTMGSSLVEHVEHELSVSDTKPTVRAECSPAQPVLPDGGSTGASRSEAADGFVVRLPEQGGGRLECDRIILADGTAISLFENEKEKEKAMKESRVRQDEELARMLQEEEHKLVEQEKRAAHDRKLALEYQDMELAKELQRKEVVRLQRLKRERQLRRAQSAEAGEMQAARRLPSYEEAMQRNGRSDMPDLLEGEASAIRSSPHQDAPSGLPTEGAVGYAEAGDSAVLSSHGSSPPSSQEHSLERLQRSSSASSHSSYRTEGSMHSQQSPLPCSSEGVWERLYEEEQLAGRSLTRSYTVSTSQPTQHENTEIPVLPVSCNRTTFNIAECIDPTYQPGQREPPSAAEGKPKTVPLIQPQRRRSSDKKRREKSDREKENCKQQ